MKGLSRSNLFYMRGFAAAWPDPIVQQAVGQLPWGHITVLLDKLDSPEVRCWYASAAVEYGWSRNVLMNKTLQRSGAAPSNFVQRLVGPDSELAQQVAKDPYNFESLGLSGEVAELLPSLLGGTTWVAMAALAAAPRTPSSQWVTD